MDTVSLKRYILDNNKCELILSSIGCHNIKHNASKEYISAAMPDGDNLCGAVIYLTSYLNYVSFSRGITYEEGKDIIDLVQTATNKNFVDSIKYIHNLLGLEYTPYQKKKEPEKPKFDPLGIFKNVVRRKRKIDVAEIQALNEELINDYVPLLHIDWFREGIMEWTRKKFGIAYSYKHKRVVIPLRHWMTGDLLGFNMRTTIENYKELGIKKYIITPTYQKHLNLFGLYQNYDTIQKAGYVVIAESEKSVLKRDSLGDSTLVALSGKTISDEQVRILIGLNVEIVVMMDNDVDINEIRNICERFYKYRKVSYIKDNWELLEDKSCAADSTNKIYNFLLKYKTAYDINEHNKYLESLEKGG